MNEGASSKGVNFTAQPRRQANQCLHPHPIASKVCQLFGMVFPENCCLRSVFSPQPCVDGHLVARVKQSRVFYYPHLTCEPALCLITKHTIISCANSWQMGTGLWTQSIQLTRLYNPKWGTLDSGIVKFAV